MDYNVIVFIDFEENFVFYYNFNCIIEEEKDDIEILNDDVEKEIEKIGEVLGMILEKIIVVLGMVIVFISLEVFMG